MATIKYKDENGRWQEIAVGGGETIEVDSELSTTSGNPVQNKVITEALADKVDKVDGKQLSAEDFTTTLKQKLDGLTNYDDANLRSAITELQNNLNAIVNGDATSAIDSIQEILAFLSTITDTQTLAGIVADLKQYVDDKVASGGGGSIAVDDALSFESTNPVQNKVIAENLDGIMYLDLELSALDANGLNSFYAKLSTLIDNSGRVKSFYCSYKGEVVKVDRLCMIGESTYVFITKGVLQYVMVGTGLAELPWVFIGGMNNQLSYFGLRNLSAVCKDAVIEIDDIRYPVTSYEYGTSSITLYAIIKDHLNQYEVDGDGNMNLVSSESIIGGSITLDSGMSDESDNAVSNKVIKGYVDGLVGDVNSLLDTINGEEV